MNEKVFLVLFIHLFLKLILRRLVLNELKSFVHSLIHRWSLFLHYWKRFLLEWIIFKRILRGGPVSFSRILRSNDNYQSLNRILRSEAPVNVASGEDEKRLSRILRTPEFSRLLRSQTFSRILKRSGLPEEEAFLLVEQNFNWNSNPITGYLIVAKDLAQFQISQEFSQTWQSVNI